MREQIEQIFHGVELRGGGNSFDLSLPLVTTVSSREVETHEAVTISVRSEGLEHQRRFRLARAGQFFMLGASRIGEVPISLSGIERELLQFTIRRVGAVTSALTRLQPESALLVRGPFGNGWPEVATTNLLLVGGGIGLAPLRPVIHRALDSKHHTLTVIYGARSPREVLFSKELSQWGERLNTFITVDRGERQWVGRVGTVIQPLISALSSPGETTVFLCGPELMMKIAADHLVVLGVPSNRIWLSLERNMQCGYGVCGRCQLGPVILCRDGPVLNYADSEPLLRVREL